MNSNLQLQEYLADEHRSEIQREVKKIQLAEKAQPGRRVRANLYTNGMRALGKWLILRGERLVAKYEIRSAQCKSSPRSFAH